MSDKDDASFVETGDSLRHNQGRALKVPGDALVDYLNRMSPDNKCSFCYEGEYAVVPGTGGSTAGVVATPVPHVQHLGVWFYLATCRRCGHTVFFNAPFVLAAMAVDR